MRFEIVSLGFGIGDLKFEIRNLRFEILQLFLKSVLIRVHPWFHSSPYRSPHFNLLRRIA